MRVIFRFAAALLVVGGLVAGLFRVPTPATAQGDCTVAADKLALDAEEESLLRLVNAHRAANSVEPALLQSETLRRVATDISVNDAKRGVSSLLDGYNRGQYARFLDCGYRNFPMGVVYPVSYTLDACCDSGSVISAEAAFSVWKSSSRPNEHMLDPRARFVGVSRECPVADQCFWSLTLGTAPSGMTEAVPSGGAGPAAPAQVPTRISRASFGLPIAVFSLQDATRLMPV